MRSDLETVKGAARFLEEEIGCDCCPSVTRTARNLLDILEWYYKEWEKKDELLETIIVTDQFHKARLIKELTHKVWELEQRIASQRHTLKWHNEALRRKNLELDAMHFVWCDGGCKTGVHRWTDNTVSQEVVDEAKRQVKRLDSWWRIFLRKVNRNA